MVLKAICWYENSRSIPFNEDSYFNYHYFLRFYVLYSDEFADKPITKINQSSKYSNKVEGCHRKMKTKT